MISFAASLRRVAFLIAACCTLAAGSVDAREHWRVLSGCRLSKNLANDADSFHVRAGASEYIFRLYFVDAPETDAVFPERLEEQAKYFKLTPLQTIELGRLAARFTREKLAQPFTVRTCMQDALGRSDKERFYAFIAAKEGDLAELLVANGLARVHGSAAKPEGLSSPERMWLKLKRLEREAKLQKVGAWGASAGRMTARLAKQPPKSGADSFDAFFHPERVMPVPEPETTPAIPAPGPAQAGGSARGAGVASKLDINTASAEELEALPSVGEVIAQRIIAARPYETADALANVPGIGPKRYTKLRPYFR